MTLADPPKVAIASLRRSVIKIEIPNWSILANAWIKLDPLLGSTPFAVYLRKMYIHLRQQLKL